MGRIDSVNIDDDTVDMAEKLFMLSEDSMFHAKILGLVLTARDFEPAGTIGKLFESVRGLPESIETYESDDDKK